MYIETKNRDFVEMDPQSSCDRTSVLILTNYLIKPCKGTICEQRKIPIIMGHREIGEKQ